jgi:hypothetical protein
MIFDNQISWDGIAMLVAAVSIVARFIRLEEKTKSNSKRLDEHEQLLNQISNNQRIGVANLEVLTALFEERTGHKVPQALIPHE